MLYYSAMGIRLIFGLIAFGAGTVRETVLLPRFGDRVAHVVGTLVVIALFLVVMFLYFQQLEIEYARVDLVLIGVMWVFMTILLEIGFVRLVLKHSWRVIWKDYDLTQGRIWILVLMTLLLGPLAVGETVKRGAVESTTSATSVVQQRVISEL